VLFHGAEAAVSFNGETTGHFPIQRGVRQGCPLAPYLFLLVAKTLHSATRAIVSSGTLTGITLLDQVTQLSLPQYADDMTFSLTGEERNL
jgi:hypothetical protein